MTISSATLWLAFGFFGQFLFAMRFVIQWLKSEQAKKSVMPIAFWYFSILGGLTLFVYALHTGDPVFIFGQGMGLAIYFRNLHLIYNEKRRNRLAAEAASE